MFRETGYVLPATVSLIQCATLPRLTPGPDWPDGEHVNKPHRSSILNTRNYLTHARVDWKYLLLFFTIKINNSFNNVLNFLTEFTSPKPRDDCEETNRGFWNFPQVIVVIRCLFLVSETMQERCISPFFPLKCLWDSPDTFKNEAYRANNECHILLFEYLCLNPSGLIIQSSLLS